MISCMRKKQLPRLLLPLFWTAASAFAGDIETTLQEAEALFLKGSYEKVIPQLSPLAEKSTEAAHLLCRTFWATGRADKALSLAESTLSSEKADQADDAAQKLALLRAEILFQTGDLHKAEVLLRALTPSPASLLLLGNVLTAQGKTEEAKKQWEAAIPFYQSMDADTAEKAPAELFVTFGEILVALNRFEEANSIMLAQALEKDPDDLSALKFGGTIFGAKYDFPESRRLFKKALDIAPRDPDLLSGLAKTTLDNPMRGGKRLEEAKQLVAEALDINPRHEGALLLAGDILFFDGLFEEAKARYRKALDADPASFEALGALYSCAHMNFQKEKKKQIEKQALAINPKPAAFYHAAGRRCTIQCHYPESLKLANRAHQTDPSYWPLYTELVLGELRAAHYKRAVRFINEGLDVDAYNLWLSNTKKLLEYWERDYVVKEWGGLSLHLPRKHAAYYSHYLGPLLQQAASLFEERYGITAPKTIHIEVYSKPDYFGCRVLGLPDFPAQGVCFGPVIAVLGPENFPGSIAISAWHEFAHVFTVTASGYYIPRWFTEGISVREEGLCPVGGTRSYLHELGLSLARNDLPAFTDFDRRFRRPRNGRELLTAYALSPLAIQYLIDTFGHTAIRSTLKKLKFMPFTRAFREATGKELSEFDAAFRAHLEEKGRPLAAQFVGEGVDPATLKDGIKEASDKASAQDRADLAWALLKNNQEIDAENAALKLADVEGFQGESAAIRGFIASNRGKTEEAASLLDKALELKTRNTYQVLLKLASIAGRREKDADKAKYLERAWRMFPGLSAEKGGSGALGQLCMIYAESKSEKLEKALTELVAHSRHHVWAIQQLAAIKKEKEEYGEQLELLKKMVYIVPFRRDGGLNTELFEELIACAEKTGNKLEAARARNALKGSR